MAAARAEGRSLVRAVLAACPGLGPRLAREMDGSAASLVALRGRLRDAAPDAPRPRGRRTRGTTPTSSTRRRSRSPRSPSRAARGPRCGPRPGSRRGRSSSRRAAAASSSSAAAAPPSTRRAGRSGASSSWRRTSRRTSRGSPTRATCGAGPGRFSPSPAGPRPGRSPSSCRTRAIPRRVLVVALDPRLGGLANAERLFEKARRVERARHQIDLRLRETRSALVSAREGEARRAGRARHARAARSRGRRGRRGPRDAGAGPRHYLTGRGLSVLVGRNARENHHLTFRVARAEDLWLHARDAPGAHVVLRDNEGRAGADDLREAAEVAAFFSEARGESLVDVHVTRRKHVKPAPGRPRPRLRRALRHAARRAARPRGPAARKRLSAHAVSSAGCRRSSTSSPASWPPPSAAATRRSRRGRRGRPWACCCSGRWRRCPWPWQLGASAVLFVVGSLAAGRVARLVGLKDPGIVVVDEVVGQWVTLTALPFTPLTAGRRLPALPRDGHREAVAGAGPRAACPAAGASWPTTWRPASTRTCCCACSSLVWPVG